MSGPLSGVKVVDVCQLAVGPLAAAWLGQLGADVIKIEAPTGDPIRGLEPSLQGVTTYYTAVNVNKRSIALDLKNANDRDIALDLIRKADVFVQNFRPGAMDRLGLGYADLRSINEAIVYASCSGYGSTGPRRSEGAGDPFIRMFTAFDNVNGKEGEQAQRFRNRGHVDHICSAYLLEAILAALLVQRQYGYGQLVETTMMESTLAYQSTVLAEFLATGVEPIPMGSAGSWWCPDEAFAVKDGYIGVTVRTDAQWQSLCDCLGIRMDDGIRQLNARARRASRERIVDRLADVFRMSNGDEWTATLAGHGVPCAPFLTVDQMIEHPQARENNTVIQLAHPWGDVCVADAPWQFSRTSISVRRAPGHGEHGGEILAELANGSECRSTGEHHDMDPATGATPGGPLDGIRLVEVLSNGLGIPYAAMQAAQLGAKVIKVEPPDGDALRQVGSASRLHSEFGAVFGELNKGKRCIGVDVNDRREVGLLKDLIRGADVLVTDVPMRDLVALEIDYESTRTYNPTLIYCHLSGYGAAGPLANASSSELTIQAATGAWQYLGTADDAPLRVGDDIAETAAGVAALQGVLAALIERTQSNEGQLIRVSELGVMAALESHLIAATSTGSSGGGWHLPAPGLLPEYPLMSNDTSLDFSLPDEFAFIEFHRALGVPADLGEDPRFTDKYEIVLNWTEYLDKIGPYVQRWSGEAIKEFVTAFGGMCVLGNTYSSLIQDPQMQALQVLSHCDTSDGKATGLRPPWGFGRNAARETCAAPRLAGRIAGDEWGSTA